MTERELIKKAFGSVRPSDGLIEKILAMSSGAAEASPEDCPRRSETAAEPNGKSFSKPGSEAIIDTDAYVPAELSDLNYGSSAVPKPEKAPKARRAPSLAAIGGLCAAAALAITIPLSARGGGDLSSAVLSEDRSAAAASYSSEVSSDIFFPVDIDCSAQYIRTDSLSANAIYQKTVWITDTDELMNYYNSNKNKYLFESAPSGTTAEPRFEDIIPYYDDEFFKKHDLLMIVLDDFSGAVEERLTSIILKSDGSGGNRKHLVVNITNTAHSDLPLSRSQWHVIVTLKKGLDVDRDNIGISRSYVYDDDELVPKNWLRVYTRAEVMERVCGSANGDLYIDPVTSGADDVESVVLSLVNRNVTAFVLLASAAGPFDFSDTERDLPYYPDNGGYLYFPINPDKYLPYFDGIYSSGGVRISREFIEDFMPDFEHLLSMMPDLNAAQKYFALVSRLNEYTLFNTRTYIEITDKTENTCHFKLRFPDFYHLNEPDEYTYYYFEKTFSAERVDGSWRLNGFIFDSAP